MRSHRAEVSGSRVVLDHPDRPTIAAGPTVSVRLGQRGAWTTVQVDGDLDIQVLPLAGDLLRRTTANVVWTRCTVALDDAARLEVLEAMKVAEVDDRIRTAAQTIYQALVDAAPQRSLPAVVAGRPCPGSRL